MTKPKSRKPANTAFKQQRLRAWQPILTPKAVIPTFLLIGAIFIPIGIGLLVVSNNVQQVVFDYTNCKSSAPSTLSPPGTTQYGPINQWKYDNATKACTISFSIDNNFQPPVFLYYRLTNFYQNHRTYVKSYDGPQLLGTPVSADALTTSCDPLRKASGVTFKDGSKPDSDAQYYPCGLIANSMFTDIISNLSCVSTSGSLPDNAVCNSSSSSNYVYSFSENGISWPADSEKFGKTQWINTSPKDIPKKLVPPDAWRAAYPDIYGNGYNISNIPDLSKFYKLQVWMRTAGLPTFRKLWGRNDATALTKGTWSITIEDKFDVTSFGGTKSIVISTVSFLGGKNPFLGTAYIVVGAVCVVLGLVFLVRQMVSPRKMGDHTYLSWNKE